MSPRSRPASCRSTARTSTSPPSSRAALLIIDAKAREKNIAVHDEVTPICPWFSPIGCGVKQILINIMSNAVGVAPEKGAVTLSARCHDRDFVLVSVPDNGPGMSAAEVDMALRPFGQVNQGFNKRHEGTGLGLPISLALARLHKGNLTVSSEQGKGTCVSLYLPVYRQQDLDTPAAEQAPCGAQAAPPALQQGR